MLISDEESEDSDGERRPPQPSRRRASTTASNANGLGQTEQPFQEEFIQLPTKWNDEDRSTHLHISPDGREVSFSGAVSSGDRDAAAVRANFPMPRACGIYYYEIEVLQRGQKGCVFGSSQVSLQRLPGWEQTTRGPVRPRESWGYHGDDGHSFASKDTGERYGPKFTTGDIVGCGVDFTIGRAFYTKNGAFLALLGHVFENIDGELYPMIGMRSSGEAIRANFGHAPFKYDIESHAHLQRNATWLGIQSKPVAWSHNSIKFETPSVPSSSTQPDSNRTAENDTREAIEKIIMDYLSHHGYAGTAEAFRLSLAARSTTAAALSSSTNSSSTDILARQRIEAALLDGKIDVVIDTMGDRYPEALSAEGGWLLFRLRCRKFVELVLEASDAVKAAAKAEPRPSPINGVSSRSLAKFASAMPPPSMAPATPAHAPPRIRAFLPSPPQPRGLITDGSSSQPSLFASTSASSSAAQAAMDHIMAFGRQLDADYGADERPRVQSLFQLTVSLVAYVDPRIVGGEVGHLASHEARIELAIAVNEGILASQGRHPRPVLERAYEHTAAMVMHLGLTGTGAAAYADIERELLQEE
ncbi:SPRY-domain-containing protein [Clavulina sp. PMI_390]|nr:SPRY-domain-containing protein [Clavulina sp. PMI_390]